MIRKWVVLLTFAAVTPEDEMQADRMADDLSGIFAAFTDAVPYVVEGSVNVEDVDTIGDDEEVGWRGVT